MSKEKVKKPIFKRVWFWVVVVIVVFAALGSLGGNDTEEGKVQNDTVHGEDQAQEKVSEEGSEPQNNDEDVKADAKSKDLEIYSAVLSAETKFNGMISELDSGNLLDIYDSCKETKDFAQDCWGRVSDQKDDLNEDYADACQSYFIEIKLICDDIMDYVDSQKMEDLSSAKEGIERINSHIVNIVSARMAYLVDAGFTDEEISEIVET